MRIETDHQKAQKIIPIAVQKVIAVQKIDEENSQLKVTKENNTQILYVLILVVFIIIWLYLIVVTKNV